MRTNLRISDLDLRQVLACQLQLSWLRQRRWPDEIWYMAERCGKREAIAAVQHARDTLAVRTVMAITARVRA